MKQEAQRTHDIPESNTTYMNELRDEITTGRYSRARAKIAPSTKMKTKASSVFTMYRKLIAGLCITATRELPPKFCRRGRL